MFVSFFSSFFQKTRLVNPLHACLVWSNTTLKATCGHNWCTVQLKRDGTRWRTGREEKGKLANGVGSQMICGQYPSLPRNLVYPPLLPLMRTPRLPVVDWTGTPAGLNGLVRFAERQILVSAHVPSRFKRGLQAEGLGYCLWCVWFNKENLCKYHTMRT